MPLLNYTTSITVEKTIGEIIGKLAFAGVSGIQIDYGKDRQPNGLAFAISTAFGDRSFRLPANVEAVERILVRDWKAGKVDRRHTSREQAARVAWRIIKDWLEAQLALIEAGQATIDQVMLPYLESDDGRTLYQLMVEKRLALPAPREASR